MTKKDYMQPTMNVEKIQDSQMLCFSNAQATGLDDDGLGYDKNGGNQANAWSRGSNGWNDGEEEEW